MKRFYLGIVLSLSLFLSSCDSLKQIASQIGLSEFEMGAGLKDALSQGLFRGFNAFADPNGNPLVRFVFPGDAAKIETAACRRGEASDVGVADESCVSGKIGASGEGRPGGAAAVEPCGV